jgi:hypothetical protein
MNAVIYFTFFLYFLNSSQQITTVAVEHPAINSNIIRQDPPPVHTTRYDVINFKQTLYVDGSVQSNSQVPVYTYTGLYTGQMLNDKMDGEGEIIFDENCLQNNKIMTTSEY